MTMRVVAHSFALLFPLALLPSTACSSSSSGDATSSTEDSGTSSETGDETSDETGSTTGEDLSCAAQAPEALRACVSQYSQVIASCYANGDAPCADNDSDLAATLDALEATLLDSCADGEFGGLDPEALVGRLRNACASEAGSMSWRTYGGPQGAVWPPLDAEDQGCVAAAHGASHLLADASLAAINNCIAEGSDCDLDALAEARASAAASAQSDIESSCDGLDKLIAVDAETLVERVGLQVDCLSAMAHADPGDVPLKCGPSHTAFTASRGEWTQIIVDGDEWGTLCGDGTPYAFQVRLAPEGEPLDKVLIGMQGGGVCLFQDDCLSRFESNPGLFNAMDDEPYGFGIASTVPGDSPFANWTQIYLPYCNQDVFAGGGVDEDFGSLILPRYGGVNVRAAVRMVRDVIWKEMDEAGDAGFRPDELIALVGGWSAGGYGTLYNYHWFLDDLQWPRTTAFPDAGLALDNGTPLGISGLGAAIIPSWGTLPNLPPYCFDGACAVGQVLIEAISPRLKHKPEQQMLMLTNPYDLTQQGDAFFNDVPTFVNVLRQTYCDTKDLPGIHWYLTSVSSSSVHVVTLNPALWVGEVAGEAMDDWFDHAMSDPDSLEDRAEEADFVEVFSGVEAFPCEVAP